ncbi:MULTISPECIES: hypothetical protein [Haloarcula]|uniref:hypothetical protein n=1 Tax=Haloarcula TaxID=2237 RepID=UPI0023EBF878|nr:hypothetical protein [Halomicroarcula sp. XH51]
MSQVDNDSTNVTATNHSRVFYKSPEFNRGELETATRVADAINDQWRVFITIGPFRGYNIHYNLEPETQTVWLDFYSVRPAEGYNLQQVIEDIKKGIQQART